MRSFTTESGNSVKAITALNFVGQTIAEYEWLLRDPSWADLDRKPSRSWTRCTQETDMKTRFIVGWIQDGR